LHPQLVRLGFLEFVAERRKDTHEPRLFPELKNSADGYFSDNFTKWFGRFVALTLGAECGATFHSFRHHFRDALRVARAPEETVALLGGWQRGDGNQNRQMAHYGRGPDYLRALARDVASLSYAGLDLSHLEPVKRAKKAVPPRPRFIRSRPD
jgi:integrase